MRVRPIRAGSGWAVGLLLGWLPLGGHAQPAADASTEIHSDSLWRQLPALHGSRRVQALNQLAHHYRRTAPDSARAWAEQARELAQRSNNPAGLAAAHRTLGALRYLAADYPSAMVHYRRARDLYESLGDSIGVAGINFVTGTTHQRLQDAARARTYLLQAAATLRRHAPQHPDLAATLNNLGEDALRRKAYNQALTYFRESLEQFTRLNDPHGIAENHRNMGEALLGMRLYAASLQELHLAATQFAAAGNTLGIARTQVNLAESLSQNQQPERALAAVDSALRIARRRHLPEVERDASRTHAKLLAWMGRAAEAYDALSRYYVLDDSLSTVGQARQVMFLESEAALAKKQLEIDLLRQEQSNQRLQRNLLILGVVALCLVALALFYAFRQKQATNHALAESVEQVRAQRNEIALQNTRLNQALAEVRDMQQQLVQREKMAALGSLVANLAHRLNSPLGAIRASAQNVEQRMPTLIRHLEASLPILTPSERSLLAQLIEAAQPQRLYRFSSREERRYRRELTRWLTELGSPEPQSLADALVLAAVLDATPFAEALRSPQALPIALLAADWNQVRMGMVNVLHSTDRSVDVIQALRMLDGSATVEPAQTLPLRHTLTEAVSRIRPQLRQTQELVLSFDADPWVTCPPNELGRVWMHLLDNALLALQDRPDGSIEVRLGQHDDSALLEITDTGAGIPQEILPRVFEPFFSTRGSGEGSGLGLYLCQKVVESLRGTISIFSGGEGTRIVVCLPLAVPPAPEAPAAPAPNSGTRAVAQP